MTSQQDITPENIDNITSISLEDLKLKKPPELIAFAEAVGVENASSMRKQEIFFVQINGSGVLEVLNDGFGFLRAPEANYLPGPDDIYVTPKQIRKYSLKTGDTISGEIRSPRDNERYFALTTVLTPLYPDQRFKMEIEDPTRKDRSGRIIDIVSPLGKGQRALIVAPPRTGKTVLLQNIAHSIEANHPECYVIVLLILMSARKK